MYLAANVNWGARMCVDKAHCMNSLEMVAKCKNDWQKHGYVFLDCVVACCGL